MEKKNGRNEEAVLESAQLETRLNWYGLDNPHSWEPKNPNLFRKNCQARSDGVMVYGEIGI